jgi:hypothetical protein
MSRSKHSFSLSSRHERIRRYRTIRSARRFAELAWGA